RAALERTIAANRPELAVRLAGALGRFWVARGYTNEGRRWLARALALGPDPAFGALAKAYAGAGTLAYFQSDYPSAREALERALAGYRATGDQAGEAATLRRLGDVARAQHDYARAAPLLEAALALSRRLDDRVTVASSLIGLGNMAIDLGDLAT